MMTATEFCKRYATQRKGTDSLKWDAMDKPFGAHDLIPLWVADVDFKAPEQVRAALQQRIDHGVFGYSIIPDAYYDAVIAWQQARHGNRLERDWFFFSTGVVTALYRLINAFTRPGDNVMIVTPVYYPFHDAARDTGRTLVPHKLDNCGGRYTYDFERFERDIIAHNVKLLIESSPHNPVGRVWTADELSRLLSICRRHGVLVVSDEIHQDIIVGGIPFTPAFAADGGAFIDHVITVTSASKTFNLAGLLQSHIFIPNPALRDKFSDYVKTVDHTPVNLLGCIAMQAAYTHGAAWLSGLLAVVRENHAWMQAEFARALPKLILSPLEGTYLLWADLRAYLGTEGVQEFMQGKCRLAVDYGEWFCPDAKGFVRFNLATEPRYIQEAAAAIIRALT